MRLYLVRHAQAESGDPDELRRLTPAGRAAARDVGRRLAAEGIRPAAVVASPLLRARETAEEIARATGSTAEPDDRLAPGATATDLLDAVSGRDDPLVVVGHQPDCGRIAATLAGGEEPAFPPAGMVVIDV